MTKLSGSIPLSLAFFIAAGLVGCATSQTTQEEPAAAPAETQPAPQTRPAPAQPAPRAEMPMEAEPMRDDSYLVRYGDHLWGISGQPQVYGDPYRWPLLYKANQDRIEDADLIYPGQVLTISRSNTPFEIDAAVHHARTRGAWSLGAVEDTDREYLAGRRYAADR